MTAPASLFPPYVTADDLAAHFGVGDRWIKKKAREIGAYGTVAKKMVFFQHHVEMLMEAFQPCHLKSTVAAKSGTTGELLPEGDYEALRVQRTKPARKGSRRKPKPSNGKVISMDRGRM